MFKFVLKQKMKLIPIQELLQDNPDFINNPDCKDSLNMSVDYYKVIGFNPPWICYYAEFDGQLVGCAAIKGKPVNNRVEIAYGVFPQHQRKGVGAEIGRTLTQLVLATDPSLTITARTSAEENFSTRMLRKNGYKLTGLINDPEDGDLWEWEYVSPLM